MAARVLAECTLPVSDTYAHLANTLDLAHGGNDRFHGRGSAFQILGDKCVDEVLKPLPTRPES